MSTGDRFGRVGRVGRRPDHWSSPHERARIRAAERLAAPLSAHEETWLEAHLADCDPCRAIADAYVDDRLVLRQSRDDLPTPPRDLWARTAAGIEQQRSPRRPARRAWQPQRASRLPALGALSGLAVVALVVIGTAIAGGFLGRFGRDVTGPAASIALASQEIVRPTAIAVGAGNVHWLGARDDGAFAYNVADIHEVCPHDRQPDCAPFEDGNAKRVTLSATPRFVYGSPGGDHAVVVGTDFNGADAVLIVALPTPDPTPEVSPGSSSPGSTPIATAGTQTSGPPTDLPTVSPTDVPSASLASIDPTASGVASAEPDDPVAVAIITGVTVVGRAAAYSPDGTWFAFSARPVDGTAGPDIYVWHVGELQARAVTTDHASIFASWVGGSLLGSRLGEAPVDVAGQSPPIEPTPDTAPPVDVSPAPDASAAAEVGTTAELLPATFLLDPGTGMEIARLDAEWQPAVDPTGLAVVAWQGTVGIGGDGLTAAPVTGNLVVHPFHGPLASEQPSLSPEASLSPDASPLPDASPSPEATAEISPSASPQVLRDFPTQIVATGPVADFDARWDETGSWLAIWIADPTDPGLGRLSLLHFDPLTGLIDRPTGAPQGVTSLPGFSIGFGRLAWASPPGQGGEGSRIQIAAWTSDEVGAVESIPVAGAVVVQ